MDQKLAFQALYKAKENKNNIPKLLQKPTEGKWTKEVIQNKTKELLDALNVFKWIDSILQDNKRLKADNERLQKEIDLITAGKRHTIKHNTPVHNVAKKPVKIIWKELVEN